MHFVWAGNREEVNQNLVFSWRGGENPEKLILCAVDFFRIYINDEFVAYGPERAPQGYARPYKLSLKGANKIEIYVSAYNVPTYCCDLQLPYFAVELLKADEVIAQTEDFICYNQNERRQDVPRYSYQRGFIEVYDYNKKKRQRLKQYSVLAPTIIEGLGDTANYEILECLKKSSENFEGVSNRHIPWWYKKENYKTPKSFFDVDRDFLQETKTGYCAFDYELDVMKTGFIRLEVKAEEEISVFAVFEEVLVDGEWVFGRSNNNDVIHWVFPKGKYVVWTAEPYLLKYLKVLVQGRGIVIPSLVVYENSTPSRICVEGNEKICKLIQAAENSFRQNAVDIFTDCPGRERAGWLCDSYFTALSERLFFGENRIERQFLENIILAKTEDIDAGMLPKCFPAEQQSTNDYIPNWAMWFVLELADYQSRTEDFSLVLQAKEKVYKLLDFFQKFENEYGLLEDLSGSVFVEWSVSNREDYICGVNFPTNMLYSKMLECVAGLYNDKNFFKKAQKLRRTILRFSFNGEFFVDNSIRVDGKLVRQDNHISETCQYYALFFGLDVTIDFKKKIIEQFGPLRKGDTYPNIGKSNMFIGTYLRLFWLCEQREYERVFKESFDYFYKMAEWTGTLWEHDAVGIGVSCNHGFASVAAVLFLRALTGYLTTKEGNPIFDNLFKKESKYDAKVIFYCENGETVEK